jgi:hypothetical protein
MQSIHVGKAIASRCGAPWLFELLIAAFAAPHNLSGDVMSMICRF